MRACEQLPCSQPRRCAHSDGSQAHALICSHALILPSSQVGPRRQRPKAAVRAWRLEESCWKERAQWSDSKTWLDSEAVYVAAWDKDWATALRCHELIKYALPRPYTPLHTPPHPCPWLDSEAVYLAAWDKD